MLSLQKGKAMCIFQRDQIFPLRILPYNRHKKKTIINKQATGIFSIKYKLISTMLLQPIISPVVARKKLGLLN